MPDMPSGLENPLALSGVLLIYLLAGMVKGGLGFGLPLTSMALLPLLVPVDLALAVNAIMLFVTNAYQFLMAGRVGETLRRFWPVVLGVALGVPVASLFVSIIDPATMTLVLGLGVAIFAVLTAMQFAIPVRASNESPIGLGIGLLAGVAGTLTTTNGPIFVAYLVGLKAERPMMISALGLFLLASGALITGSFASLGMVTGDRLVLAALCVPPAFVGMAVGNAVFRRLPPEAFRRIILAALFLLGLNLVARGLMG